jgi:hypothetical protein
MNTPYVKNYSKEGLITNPITKEQPYLNTYKTSKQKRDEFKQSKNNSKSIRLVITNIGKGIFMRVKLQRVVLEQIGYQFRGNKVKRKYKTILNQSITYSK